MPIFITQLISHGEYHLHTAPLPLCRRTLHPWGLSLGTLNIRDSQGSGFSPAIQVVQISIFKLMILMETNILDQAYCYNRLVYNVVLLTMITVAAGGEQGGVCLVVRDQPQG